MLFRSKAAAASLPFERPKLAATMVYDGRGDRILATLRYKQALIERGVGPGHADWNGGEPLLIEGTAEPVDTADALRDARVRAAAENS